MGGSKQLYSCSPIQKTRLRPNGQTRVLKLNRNKTKKLGYKHNHTKHAHTKRRTIVTVSALTYCQ